MYKRDPQPKPLLVAEAASPVALPVSLPIYLSPLSLLFRVPELSAQRRAFRWASL